MNNQASFEAVYLSGVQLDNLYRLNVKRYASDNPEKVRVMHSVIELKETNTKVVGSGAFVIVK